MTTDRSISGVLDFKTDLGGQMFCGFVNFVEGSESTRRGYLNVRQGIAFNFYMVS